MAEYVRCYCIVHESEVTRHAGVVGVYKDSQLAEYDLRGGLAYFARLAENDPEREMGGSWFVREQYLYEPRYSRWYGAEGDKLIAADRTRQQAVTRPDAPDPIRVDPYIPPNACVTLSREDYWKIGELQHLLSRIIGAADAGHPARQASVFLDSAISEYTKAFIRDIPEE